VIIRVVVRAQVVTGQGGVLGFDGRVLRTVARATAGPGSRPVAARIRRRIRSRELSGGRPTGMCLPLAAPC
jgi:hypothetical protein